jgi:aspartate aminotransferase-like enzyme
MARATGGPVQACRNGLVRLGLELYRRDEALSSPTVTAVHVPPNMGWQSLNDRLRRQGVVLSGNYAPLAGKVFRIGHMGSQADETLVQQTLAALSATTAAAV